jgi:hypothetical protein
VLVDDGTTEAYRIENCGEAQLVASGTWEPPEYAWPELWLNIGGASKFGAGPVRAVRTADGWEFVQYDGRDFLVFFVEPSENVVRWRRADERRR